MCPCFNEDDKGLCIDGCIEMYSSEHLAKENLIGRIHVQIKGTETEPPSGSAIKERVSVADLRKYSEVYKAVLYFYVVEEEHAFESNRIYYRSLLPADLKEILATLSKDDQGTVTLSFSEFPTDPKEMHRICLDFLRDKERQTSSTLFAFKSPDLMKKKGLNVTDYEITMTRFPGELLFPTLKDMERGIYVYGKTDWGGHFVVDKLEAPESLTYKTQSCFSSGNASITTIASCIEKRNQTIIEFNGFSIFFEESRVSFKSIGSFRKRLEDLELAREVARTGMLAINGHRLFKNGHFDSTFRENVDKNLAYYRRYATLLDLLAVKEEWDPRELSERDIYTLDLLAKGIIDGKPVDLGFDETLSAESQATIVNFSICSCSLMILAKCSDSDKGKYEIFDLLGESDDFVLGISESTLPNSPIHSAPALLDLSQEDFRLACNLDAQRFKDSCEKYPIHPEIAEQACSKLLEMLNAYDEGAVCPGELLDCCNILADLLAKLNPSSEPYKINQLQTRKRTRPLTDEETDDARKLTSDSNPAMVAASAYILINQNDFADKLIDNFVPEEQEAFKSWPISHLRTRQDE